ncbi:MAG: GNAT family N-acetyltransferase [Candidatus Aenigmarchaeota archaeon]|nr:GNAT family N-acetyltransferase [Candidatus Aenigmarchaeota archaeon]
MQVRPARPADYPALARHFRASWQRDLGMSYPLPWIRRYLREGHRIEILGDQFFVACEGREVVGSMSVVFWEPDMAELRDWYVDPAVRGKGGGKQLFTAAMRACKRKRIRKVFAFVLPPVAGFFLARGFRQEGILKEHAAPGEDLIAVACFLRKK